MKAWKTDQEARRIKREQQAKKASDSVKQQASSSSDMTHYKKRAPGPQAGWGNGHRDVSSAQNGVKNSNYNNSRSCTKLQSFVAPTCPPSYDQCTNDDDLIDEDIYDSVIEHDFSSIKSLPLTQDIMLASAPAQEESDIIYDSADGALQTDSGNYYNFDDAIEDEIYDDVTANQPSLNSQLIEEDIYDDTSCADAFRNTPSIMFDPSHHPQPPSMDEEEDAMYSDAASVFQAPPRRTVSPKDFTIPEESEILYTDASSLFDAPPPIQSIPQVKQRSPKVSHEYPSETSYTYRSSTDGMSNSESITISSQSPAPPPVPLRSPNLMKLGKTKSTPNRVPEAPPPSHPRRSSEQLSTTPLLTKCPPSSPKKKLCIAKKRQKAVKSCSDSEPSTLVPSHQSLSPRGSGGGTNSRKSSSSSYGEVFSPPPPLRREDKHHSEPTEKFLLPTIPAGVAVTRYKSARSTDEDYAEIEDGPTDEDYAEIEDCHELSYPTSASPQEYLTPIKTQKPHRKLKESRSAGFDLSSRNPVSHSINTRPQAPLPAQAMMDNPPPKPPRTRSTSITTTSPKKIAQPSPPVFQRKAIILSDTPTAPPPPIPGRHTRCADTPTTRPPPRPVRKTPLSPQSSRNPPPVTHRAPSSINPPPPPPPPVPTTPQAHEPSISLSSSSGLLAGVQNVQLKKTSPKLPSKAPPKQAPTDSTGNLMAQMQAFKLKKTTRISEEDDTPSQHGKNNRSVSEEAHGSPVLPPVPRHKRPTPPLPSRQSVPYLPSTPQEPNPSNSNIPEWKRNIMEKKRREQEVSEHVMPRFVHACNYQS